MPLFADNPHYREYEQLLLRVHRLIAEGKGDSEEADKLRDEMDRPAAHLSRSEFARLRGLSADLYMLQNEEVPAPDWSAWDQKRFASDAVYAREWNDWSTTLSLLRKNAGRFLPSDIIAFLRHRAYHELHHADVAMLFLQFAVRLSPGNVTFRFLELARLRELNRVDEAIRLAESYLSEPTTPFQLVTASAGVLLQSTKQLQTEASNAVFQRITELLTRALEQFPAANDIPPDVRVHGHLTLGLAFDALGRDDQALRAYNAAAHIEPDNAGVLAARGMLKLRSNPTSAHADLSRAVARGTRAVFPHIVLAVEELRSRKFQSVGNLIQRIRNLTHDRRVLALTHEWTAIIAAETGQDFEHIRSEFQTAAALDPENQGIARNLQFFEEWVLSSADPQPNHDRWDLPVTVPTRLDLQDARAELSQPRALEMPLAS